MSSSAAGIPARCWRDATETTPCGEERAPTPSSGSALRGGKGADTLIGQRGTADVATYDLMERAITVNLAEEDGPGDERIRSIERVIGGSGGDTLIGNGANNHLDGRGGDDALRGYGGADLLLGRAGDDELYGGDGHDTLRGGPGRDTCRRSSNDTRYSCRLP